MGDICQTTRTPNGSNSNNEYNVNTDGSRNNNNANNTSGGVAPDYKKRQHRVSPNRPKAVQPCKEMSAIPHTGEKNDVSASDSVYSIPFGFADLMLAVKECRRDVMWKDSVAGFSLNRIMNCDRLMKELENGTYRLSSYTCFQVHEPKDRDIVATNIRDRVVQRALCDTYLYEAMTRGFSRNNMACQVGKGTTACRKRMLQYATEAVRRYGDKCCVLKVDIKGYFANTTHAVAKAAVARRVDNLWARQYVFNLIDSFHGITGDHCGIGLGSQISQLIELAVLDDLDHRIEGELGIDLFIRYMDDLVMFGTRDMLRNALATVVEYLEPLDLNISEKKTFISKFGSFEFLGFRYYRHGDGVRMELIKKKEYAERRKLRRQLGIMPLKKVDDGFRAWKANARQGTDYTVIRRMNKYYAITRRIYARNQKKICGRHPQG